MSMSEFDLNTGISVSAIFHETLPKRCIDLCVLDRKPSTYLAGVVKKSRSRFIAEVSLGLRGSCRGTPAISHAWSYFAPSKLIP